MGRRFSLQHMGPGRLSIGMRRRYSDLFLTPHTNMEISRRPKRESRSFEILRRKCRLVSSPWTRQGLPRSTTRNTRGGRTDEVDFTRIYNLRFEGRHREIETTAHRSEKIVPDRTSDYMKNSYASVVKGQPMRKWAKDLNRRFSQKIRRCPINTCKAV